MQERNLGLKDYVKNYPFRGYPFDVSEDSRFLITLFMAREKTTEDFEDLIARTGFYYVGAGKPNFESLMEFRPGNQACESSGDIFQIFAELPKGGPAIRLAINGSMEDILSYLSITEEHELISIIELYRGPIVYHLFQGKALYFLERNDEAVSEYLEGLRQQPLNPLNEGFSRPTFEDIKADIHYNLGLVYRKKSEFQKARGEFEIYLSHDSTTRWAIKARNLLREME